MKINIFPQLETEKTMETKSILKSKTFWANALVVVAGVATFLAGHEVIANYPAVVSILTVVVGGLNVALRFVTTQAIKVK
jgi:hypothetical protein